LKNIFTTRKRIIIAGVAAGAVVLGTGGAAYAYFAASASGTGSATVGTAGSWKVTSAKATGGPLTPGGTPETIVFTVKNTGSSSLKLTSVTPKVDADTNTGLVTAGGSPVPGCAAGWFTATVASSTDEPGLNQQIAANSTTPVTVTVTMPTDDNDNQTACAGASPDIDLDVS
jgi:hypothetical protein